MPALAATLALIVLAAGCVLDEVDHTGQPCPCAAGWTCTDAGICVQGDAGTAPRDARSPADVPRPDSGPSCADGRLFCDGFEDGELFLTEGPWDTDVVAAGDVVLPTTERARTGSWSLEARTNASGRQAALSAQDLGGVSDGTLWARAWLYVPSGQDVQSVIAFGVGYSLNAWVSVHLGPATTVLGLIGDDATAERVEVTRTYPTDEWFCLRMQIDVAASGRVRLFMDDGAAVGDSGAGQDTLPIGNYQQVLVGVVYSQDSQGPVRLYVDDVVVDTSEVFCD